MQVAEYNAGSTPCIAVQLPYKGGTYSAVLAMARGNITSKAGSSGSSSGGGGGGGQGAGCTCSSDGVSGGVQTGRIGCAQHLLSSGDSGYFCMVVDPSSCSAAATSEAYPGAAWVDCGPSAPAGSTSSNGSGGEAGCGSRQWLA
jgi:hypothetical protein